MAVSNRGASPDEVLDAAVHVFVSRGFDRASLADVADRAGVSVDEVRQRYATTDALLLAALSRRDDRGSEMVQLLEKAGGLDILRGVKMLAADHHEDRESAILFISAIAGAVLPGHPARAWATERYMWGRSLYAAAFRRDIEAGLIRADADPDAIASHVLATLDGLQIQWLLDPEQVNMMDMTATVIDQLIEMYGAA